MIDGSMADAPPRPTRRRFLADASATALFLAAHRQLAWAAPPRPAAASARIVRLRLQTAAPLTEMQAFYHGLLGLPVLDRSERELTVGGGATPITFVAAAAELGAPFYHFAFNIPENKLRDARAWQLERTELLPIFPDARDPGFPDDVIHFANWNAHSVFFFDPAGNVVEYIARHDLPNAAEGPFTTADILHASEIGFVVDDVSGLADALGESFGLGRYRNSSDAFAAVGDEHGLLLVFRRGRNLSLGHDRPREADVFPTRAEIRAGGAVRHAVPGFPYEVVGVDA